MESSTVRFVLSSGAKREEEVNVPFEAPAHDHRIPKAPRDTTEFSLCWSDIEVPIRKASSM